MKKVVLICSLILSLQLFCFAIYGDSRRESPQKISQEGLKLLSKGVGAVDDAIFAQIGQHLSLADFIAALYGPNRSYRRIALDSAAFVPSPWEYIPYMISFMGAGERQAASVAANSVFKSLAQAFDMRHTMQIPLTKQAAQVLVMLADVAENESLELDLRVTAIRYAAKISGMTNQRLSDRETLLSDAEPEIRVAAMQTLSLPLTEKYLAKIVKMATKDDVAELRASAVAMLCENARSHNVKKPSADLKSLVAELVKAEDDAMLVAPALICISGFPYRTRADLSDRIHSCGNEKIIKYWKSLSH